MSKILRICIHFKTLQKLKVNFIHCFEKYILVVNVEEINYNDSNNNNNNSNNNDSNDNINYYNDDDDDENDNNNNNLNNYSIEIDYLSLANFENHVINIGHINTRSLINKTLSVTNFLKWTRRSILFITETWLNSNNHDFISYN